MGETTPDRLTEERLGAFEYSERLGDARLIRELTAEIRAAWRERDTLRDALEWACAVAAEDEEHQELPWYEHCRALLDGEDEEPNEQPSQ